MGVTETSATMATETCSSHVGISSKLTVDVFNDIFKCVEPEIEIMSFEVSIKWPQFIPKLFETTRSLLQEEQGSGRGDNYTATLYRIHLWGQRRDLSKSLQDSNNEKWEKNVICKRLPENSQLREAYKSEQLFRYLANLTTLIDLYKL